MSNVETIDPVGVVDAELEAQELEEMEAPGWDVVVSAAISLAGGISLSVAIT